MSAEWESEFGSARPAGLAEIMASLVDDTMSARLSANQRAAAAWFRANGDREAAHTTGVFLKRSRVSGAAPVLGVYVDSHALATDFNVNREIYLARLANIGFEVSGIDFMPSRTGRKTASKVGQAKTAHVAPELPELDAAELAEVRSLVAQLPENLRDKASKAMIYSKRREKFESGLLS